MNGAGRDDESEASLDGAPAFRPDVVAAVRERLLALAGVEDRNFIGPPIAGLPLQPLELGELLPDLWVRHAAYSALDRFISSLWSACRDAGIEAVLAGDAATRAFAAIAEENIALAAWCLGRIAGEPSVAVREEIRRILRRPDMVRACTPAAVALAREAGAEWLETQLRSALHDDSALRRAETAALPRLSVAALLEFEKADDWYSPALSSTSDPATVLSGEPAYLEFAHEAFRIADERLDALHAGRLPYESDKAFTIHEGQVLARAARVAAKHDAPWFRTLIGRVLPRVSIAPTAAKTLPSQSVAIALGYAVQTDPTPEGVQALRDTLAAIRHAGVKKKLARNLKPAERGLAARPDVALRLLVGDARADKKRQAFVGTCLEATWCTGADWPLAQWRTELAGTPDGLPFALGQLWRATSSGAPARVLRVEAVKAGGVRFVDLQGHVAELPPDARLALWHPLQSPAEERAAWQRVVADRRQRTPLRQAFREIYLPRAEERDDSESLEFDGHELRLQPLVGLARREGWTLGAGQAGLTRRFGDLRVFFRVWAELYPGIAGNAGSGEMWFDAWRDGRWERQTLGAVDPVLYSEACRAVDLLVSVAGFAIDDLDDFGVLTVADLGVRLVSDKSPVPAPAREHPGVTRRRRLRALGDRPLGVMSQMRRRALELALAPHIAAGRVAVEARHVRVGDATVHLATGRVVENGQAVELEPPQKAALAAVPWLPYDEVLLQRIADNVAALLAR
ncbi:MAG: DUF4132 domain-containing protein [Vitreoscilla sp.]